jgi:hypothetical protein
LDAVFFYLYVVVAFAREVGAARAAHPGSDVLEGEKGVWRRSLGGQDGGERDNRRGQKAGHVYIVAAEVGES